MNADLVEEILIVRPPGIGHDGRILRLAQGLYGLKQASLAWFEKLSEALAKIGIISLPFNPYVFRSADHEIIILSYVDDITTAGLRLDINRLIDHLRSRFKATVKGSLKYIVAIEIKYTPEGMQLSRQQYISDILSCFGMHNCRPTSTPIDGQSLLVKAFDYDPLFAQNLSEPMIVAFMDLVTCTRPDLAFSVSYLSRFSSHPQIGRAHV